MILALGGFFISGDGFEALKWFQHIQSEGLSPIDIISFAF